MVGAGCQWEFQLSEGRLRPLTRTGLRICGVVVVVEEEERKEGERRRT